MPFTCARIYEIRNFGGGDIQFVEPWWWDTNGENLEWCADVLRGDVQAVGGGVHKLRSGKACDAAAGCPRGADEGGQDRDRPDADV